MGVQSLAGKDVAILQQDWKWYEERVCDLFRRIRGADVQHDVAEMGKSSGVPRQIDIRIFVPLKVDLGEGFSFNVTVKIIIDAKMHDRPVDLPLIGVVGELKDDVRADLAIVVTPTGISEAARERSKELGIRPLVVTEDLIAIASRFPPEFGFCLICDGGGEDHPYPIVFSESKTQGRCSWCNGIHICCPECNAVFGIAEVEYGQVVKCPSGCGAAFLVDYDSDHLCESVDMFLALDAKLMEAACRKTTKRLTLNEVRRIVEKTRWQHWEAGRPTITLEELGYMEYRTDGNLYLTADGEYFATAILDADEAVHY